MAFGGDGFLSTTKFQDSSSDEIGLNFGAGLTCVRFVPFVLFNPALLRARLSYPFYHRYSGSILLSGSILSRLPHVCLGHLHFCHLHSKKLNHYQPSLVW